MKSVKVAVGVILNNNTVFLCKRKMHQHQGNKWEFPGGKIEASETHEQGLARELLEEVDIVVEKAELLTTITHDYGDKCVCLYVYCVTKFTGVAKGKEDQESCWQTIKTLPTINFPDANKPIIEMLLARYP